MSFNPTLWLRRIEAIPAARFTIAAAGVIAAIGVIDHLTGTIVSLAILYMVPVAAAAWICGPRPAFALALFAAITWGIADRIGPLAEPKARIAYLNDASMLAVFVLVIAVIAILRREVWKQRDLMQEVQRHLLPANLRSFHGVDIASRWIPAWTVAGDYYDVIDAGRNRIAICLADVSGKGMSAAMIMSNVQATVRALASDGLSPERVVGTLNRLLCERLRPGLFVTVFYAVIDTRSGSMSFASAGHTPPLVRRSDGAIERLQSTGPIAGVFANAKYRCVDLQLHARDRLIVYSDGVIEYENSDSEEFGEARVREVVASSCEETADEMCSAIVNELHRFGKGRPYNDDVTMLTVLRSA